MRPLLPFLAAVLGLWLGIGQGLGHGPFHDQLADLTRRLAADPADTRLLAERCDIARAHGLWKEAEVDLLELERRDAVNPTNALRRGTILLGMGRPADSVAFLQRWVRDHETNREDRLLLAQALRGAGRWGEAATEYGLVVTQAMERRPQVYLERAESQVQAGLPLETVVAGLDAGIGVIGPNPPLVREAAELELRLGRVEAAAARIRAMGMGGGRRERWLFEEGEIYLRGANPAKARACFEAARMALESLPERSRRSILAIELEQELGARLGSARLD